MVLRLCGAMNAALVSIVYIFSITTKARYMWLPPSRCVLMEDSFAAIFV